MTLVSERINYTNDLLANNPNHKEAIIDLYHLMEDEISDGASADDELEKFLADVKQLTD